MNTPDSASMDRLDARITKLEELLTHLQRTVDELNEAVLQVQKRLDVVAGEAARLGREVLQLSDVREEVRSPAEERPPHY